MSIHVVLLMYSKNKKLLILFTFEHLFQCEKYNHVFKITQIPSKAGTHLFTLFGIACCSFGLGIIKLKDVIIIEVTLKNIPPKSHIEYS